MKNFKPFKKNEILIIKKKYRNILFFVGHEKVKIKYILNKKNEEGYNLLILYEIDGYYDPRYFESLKENRLKKFKKILS